jgi:hypothetical protein
MATALRFSPSHPRSAGAGPYTLVHLVIVTDKANATVSACRCGWNGAVFVSY